MIYVWLYSSAKANLKTTIFFKWRPTQCLEVVVDSCPRTCPEWKPSTRNWNFWRVGLGVHSHYCRKTAGILESVDFVSLSPTNSPLLHKQRTQLGHHTTSPEHNEQCSCAHPTNLEVIPMPSIRWWRILQVSCLADDLFAHRFKNWVTLPWHVLSHNSTKKSDLTSNCNDLSKYWTSCWAFPNNWNGDHQGRTIGSPSRKQSIRNRHDCVVYDYLKYGKIGFPQY